MAGNRITWRGGVLAALLLIAALSGCGGGNSSSAAATDAPPTPSASTSGDVTSAPAADQSADAEALDKVLGRQEAAIVAFAQVIPDLSPRAARMAAYFRAQEQEHVDAVLKAMRGLKIDPEPREETIEPLAEAKTEGERLEFLYEVESATIDEELSAIGSLEASWPRSLLASTVADQAQHLTLLRQALGAGPLDSVPVPFENGTAPPPE
jgi:hypothetical protein